MPENSTLFVYGALEAKEVSSNAIDLIFKNKTIRGYWLSNEIKELNIF